MHGKAWRIAIRGSGGTQQDLEQHSLSDIQGSSHHPIFMERTCAMVREAQEDGTVRFQAGMLDDPELCIGPAHALKQAEREREGETHTHI